MNHLFSIALIRNVIQCTSQYTFCHIQNTNICVRVKWRIGMLCQRVLHNLYIYIYIVHLCKIQICLCESEVMENRWVGG